MDGRLKQFLEMENLTPARFAEKMGIQRSGISHLLNGRNKPSFEFIQKMMLTYPELNFEWLILGKGRPYKNDRIAEIDGLKEDDCNLFTEIKDECTENFMVFDTDYQLFEQEPPASEPAENSKFSEPVHEVESKKSRKIDKIIVFFSDGSYEEK